jgi:hypothetical protein
MEKVSVHFKKAIESYLTKRAEEDSLFAPFFQKEGKTIDHCITYILNQVKKSGVQGFTDDEIYSMAVHYYQEDVKVGKPVNCQVVVNHTVQLTEQEKEEARKKALEEEVNRAKERMTKTVKKTVKQDANQGSLFG